MELSFVVPAYNEEAYIGECLESILKEVMICACDFEVIVVNNASTDRTKDIALSYTSVNVIDEQQKGLVRARQTGHCAAKGDLIANIDADNILPRGWLTKALREFSQNDNLVALSGPLVYYDLSRLLDFPVKIFYGFGYLTHLFNHYILRKGAMLQGGNFVVKKSAMEKIGGYNSEIDFYGEDTDVARRIQKIGRVKFTFQLPIFSSGRRIAKEGVITSGFRYAINYFWILAFSKPFSKKSTDVRTELSANQAAKSKCAEKLIGQGQPRNGPVCSR